MVRAHFERNFDQEAHNDKVILSEMPLTLQKKVQQDIHMHTLARVPMFLEEEDAALLERICTRLRSVYLLPQEMLCKQGEIASEIFFLDEGKLLQWETWEEEEEEEAVYEPLSTPNHHQTAATSTPPRLSPPPSPPPGADGKVAAHSSSRGSIPRRGSKTLHLPPLSGTATHGPAASRSAKMAAALERAQRQEPELLRERGSVVGDVSVLFGVRHIHSVEAVRHSRCLVLDKARPL